MIPLPGGEGVTFLDGDVVRKRVHDRTEAAWTQALLAQVRQDGFRVPTPLPFDDGRWVDDDGWITSEYVRDLRPAAPDWPVVIAAGLAFGTAAEAARSGGEELLDRRTHRWAVADRVAWGQEQSPLGGVERRRIESLLDAAPRTDRRFVHGDLTGNVHLDAGGAAVILDVSPYLRPPRWAAAIVVADAVLWEGADLELARSFDDRDLLGRALLFRLVAELLGTDSRHGGDPEPYRRVLAALGV